jgi:hypothetical protein
MTWTYTGDPSNSDRDKVRFLIGDTNTADQLVTDEEIAWALTEGGVYYAAAITSRSIAASFSRRVDFEVSKDLKVFYAKAAENYNKLADKLESKASRVSGTPYAGGISVADKETQEANTDRVEPAFSTSDFMNNEDSAHNLKTNSGV